MKVIVVILAGILTASTISGQGRSELYAGKQKTGLTISIDTEINATPQEVYRLWTTEQGVKQFFAPAARIGRGQGTEYTIIFFPEKDPEGLSHGTRGARILKLDPGKAVSFEWITFAGDPNLGDNAPPLAPKEMRNEFPLPTWVEITLEPIGNGQRTALHFRHYGFKEGRLWDESFRWFSRVWAGVLDGLQKYCDQSRRVGRTPNL